MNLNRNKILCNNTPTKLIPLVGIINIMAVNLIN